MTASQDAKKQVVAQEAMEYLREKYFLDGPIVIGVGTGSTTNCFIDLLANEKSHIECAVASSEATKERLKSHGIEVRDANVVDAIPVYVDGADEVNPLKQLVKGGGGAHFREKILATMAEEFICIVDDSKRVNVLSERFHIPVEVHPMARSYVARELVKLGADPVYREGFVTDNGNIILDLYNITINKPMEMEKTINAITGVVENGIFAVRGADTVLGLEK